MAKKTDAALLLKLRAIEHPQRIWVFSFLQSAISAEVVEAQYIAASRKTGFSGHSAVANALWNAYVALRDDAAQYIKHARDDGELLFAFAGTTVLEGGAA